jgi:hypothetical protein
LALAAGTKEYRKQIYTVLLKACDRKERQSASLFNSHGWRGVEQQQHAQQMGTTIPRVQVWPSSNVTAPTKQLVDTVFFFKH